MCHLARSKFQYPDLQNAPAHLVVCIENAIAPMRFGTFTKTAEKVGSRKKRPETALGTLLGASEKESRFATVFPRRPQRPPIDVGRRLEEETADSRFLQPLSSHIALFDVGRALEVTLGT